MPDLELISIREAARRLGVSDTAVRKAIDSGRVTLGSPHPTNGRPQLPWPAARNEWLANSDTSKRSHVGSKGGSRRADQYAKGGEVQLPTSDRMDELPDIPEAGAAGGGPKSGRDGAYTKARAAREVYAAKREKLSYEIETGQLVRVDTLKVEAYKVHRQVRDAVLNIADRCAPQLAAMTEAAEVHAYLLNELNAAMRQLSADIYAPPSA